MPYTPVKDKEEKPLIHNKTTLIRYSTDLESAIDQVIREKMPTSNKSEFIRRAIRYTIDHIDEFLDSDSATISEKRPVQTIAKINEIREIYDEITKYKDKVQSEPLAALSEKRTSFLIHLIGKMIFRLGED